MLDMNNLRKEKHEDKCKILDLVLIVLFAVFFILSLFPYYSVAEGDMITSRGFGDGTQVNAKGKPIEIEAKEDDSWSLLGYVGFPYNHTSVEDWQAALYKINKKTIKENDENGYKGIVWGTLGRFGVERSVTDKKGNVTQEPYQPLLVPGITTKTVSIKQVGAILFLDVFALVGIALLLLKKGIGRPLLGILWGVIGVLAFRFNYLLNMGTTPIKTIMLVVTIIVLAVSLVDFIFYFIDGRSRAAYLRSVSAAYA